jgi:hypothetical protein
MKASIGGQKCNATVQSIVLSQGGSVLTDTNARENHEFTLPS